MGAYTSVESKTTHEWGTGTISAQAAGGMTMVRYAFANGKIAAPLHEVPWYGKQLPESLDLPPLLRFLRAGTWPCVPFGGPGEVKGLPSFYTDKTDSGIEELPHGPCSNNEWSVKVTSTGVEMDLEYPKNHPIRNMQQRISFDEKRAAAVFEVTINPGEDCSLPIGLHPTFKVPAELKPGRFEKGVTHPGDFEPGAYFLKHGASFTSLENVPCVPDTSRKLGGTVDLTKLPLPFPCENLVQLMNIDGSFELHYRNDGYKITLKWDNKVFPSCALWISNGGRTFQPWNGENYCIGIEPVCSDFDLGIARCRGNNLTKQAGVASCFDFMKDRPLTTAYTITCELL